MPASQILAVYTQREKLVVDSIDDPRVIASRNKTRAKKGLPPLPLPE